MFSNQSQSGSSRAGTAKRVLSSFLETSGLVCGSLRDTVQEKLEDSDVDLTWVENEIDSIKFKLEKPRQQILNYTDKACLHKGARGDDPTSPLATVTTPGGMGVGGSFMDDNTLDGTIMTADGRTLTVSSGDLDDETMTSTLMTNESPSKSKHKSRFTPVIDNAKKREKAAADAAAARIAAGGTDVIIGLCLSRKHTTLGHPDTVTRQTAFDFNELQDRDYKYVSSTDDSGWLAGGGERGDPYLSGATREFEQGAGSVVSSKSEGSDGMKVKSFGAGHKIAAPDRVHIPIIQINTPSAAAVDEIVSALARGEIFIPEVSVLPETLSVNNTSPPDLQVRFGCEKNDDVSPEDWSNWCLEFLHNQLYDYFLPMGAQWSKRPFQITLARKVRWMTVKHMNKYFARSEQVINSWREKGPQYLQPPHSDDSSRGVILEEITRPHGIYLIQNGAPTNYFAPNFKPPYTTKMRRSLIKNVINKSWDSKRRDWLSHPAPVMRGPAQLISSVMGCTNPGYMSPVEETKPASDVGFHMRSDFDMGHDNIDVSTRTPTQEQDEVRSRKSDRKNNDGYLKDKQQQQKDSHRRQQEDREKEPHIKSSIPSDESYGTSARPSGTMSLSIDETMTEPISDTLAATPTNSNSVGSPERSKQWSAESSLDKESHDEEESKQFFDGNSRDRSSFGSSKGVSFSESSLAENEREKKLDNEQKRPQNSTVRLKVDALEHSQGESQHKLDDKLAEKFAKTKSKRREMRDRRQDENGERSTPTSKSSPSSSRRLNQSPVSPSAESMAYSMDSASQFRPPTANSTNDGGSVFTIGTENQSLLSYVTRSTMVHSRYQEEDESNKNILSDEEGDDISLSLLESRSSIVPSDEELKAVGWAKALDAHSGSYYYFTLDRSRTVWENPLATSP